MANKIDPTDAIARLEALAPVGTGPERPPHTPVQDIRDAFFPPRKGAWNAFVSNPVEVAKLSKPERRILELLCEVDPDGISYANAGLPPDIRARRRLVGLDAAGILEDRIACAAVGPGKHLRWQVLKAAIDHHNKKYLAKPGPAPTMQEWVRTGYFDLPATGWLELWTEVAVRSYGLTARDENLTSAIAAVSAADRRAWAERWLAEINGSVNKRLRDGIGTDLISSFTRAKEPVPARFTEMMKRKVATKPAKPKPKPKPKPGVYVFTHESYGSRTIETLPAPEKKQFLVAARKYAGKDFKTCKAFFAAEAKALEEPESGIEARRYVIALRTAKTKPLYEMWVFLVDNGTVFPAGSAAPTGIVMMQGGFLVERGVKNKSAAQRLADALQADVPF